MTKIIVQTTLELWQIAVLLTGAGGLSLPAQKTSSSWVERVQTLGSDSLGEGFGIPRVYHRKSVSTDSGEGGSQGQREEKNLALYGTAAWRGLQLAARSNRALRRARQPEEKPTPELVVWDGARRVDPFPTIYFAW